jgi:hypothetical protein
MTFYWQHIFAEKRYTVWGEINGAVLITTPATPEGW